MYERIILADDGSDLARAAIPRTAAIAAATGADVLVVRVSLATGASPDDLDEDDWDDYLTDESVATAAANPLEAEPHMASVVTDLHARGVTRAGSLVVHGDAADALVATADEFEADLLVVSSHGESGIRRAVLGSVAEHLVHHARETAILVNPPPHAGNDLIRRVLLPLDGSEVSQVAIPHAEHLARSLGADLVLLQVTDAEGDLLAAAMPIGTPPQPSITVEMAQQVAREQHAEAEAELAVLAGALQARAVPVVEVVVVAGQPADAIIDAVNRLSIDVVVMATHGRGGLGRLLLGSVADAVARNTERAAVLLVRPHED